MAKYWQSEIVPSHWGITTLINVCEKITDGSHFSPEIQSTGRKYITVSNLYGDKVHVEEAECISETDFEQLVQNGCQPQTGDVLLSKDGTVGRTAIVEDNDFVVLSSLGILRPKNMLISRFLKYSLDSDVMQEQMRSMMAGAALKRITLKKIQSLQLAIPPINEQKDIANYLDDRCSKIDTIIAEAKASIEEYKELKQAVIYEAVTKGLDKNVEMKDSGNQWIGKIPLHWKMNKMNRLCDTITDYVASGSFASLAENVTYLDSPDYAMLIRTADISGKRDTAQAVYVNEKAYNFLSNSNLFGGEIILPNIGASVGDVYIVPKLYEHMTLAPNSIMVRTNQSDKYYYYFFSCDAGRQMLLSIAESAAQAKFNKTELRQLRLPQPTIEEQDKIVDYLDNKTSKMDIMISEKQSLIEDLESYKKSLIYEVVTGKRKVVE